MNKELQQQSLGLAGKKEYHQQSLELTQDVSTE